MGALAELPALPLHEAGKYVAGAYLVVFVLVLVYVAIMGIRLSRIERRLGELLEEEGSGSVEPGAKAEKHDVAARESTLA
jgi:CcmD family protein